MALLVGCTAVGLYITSSLIFVGIPQPILCVSYLSLHFAIGFACFGHFGFPWLLLAFWLFFFFWNWSGRKLPCTWDEIPNVLGSGRWGKLPTISVPYEQNAKQEYRKTQAKSGMQNTLSMVESKKSRAEMPHTHTCKTNRKTHAFNQSSMAESE